MRMSIAQSGGESVGSALGPQPAGGAAVTGSSLRYARMIV